MTPEYIQEKKILLIIGAIISWLPPSLPHSPSRAGSSPGSRGWYWPAAEGCASGHNQCRSRNRLSSAHYWPWTGRFYSPETRKGQKRPFDRGWQNDFLLCTNIDVWQRHSEWSRRYWCVFMNWISFFFFSKWVIKFAAVFERTKLE